MKLVNTGLFLEIGVIFNPDKYSDNSSYFYTPQSKSRYSVGIFWHKLGISMERRALENA